MPGEWGEDNRPKRPVRRPVAVALHYEFGSEALPTVVASGKGALAERIMALAFANGVKVRKDADLAELLASVEIDSEIPLEAIYAVAEILAYIYRANGQLPAQPDTAP